MQVARLSSLEFIRGLNLESLNDHGIGRRLTFP